MVAPLFSQEQVEQLVETVREHEPIEYGLPGYGWTLKKLRRWVKAVFKCDVSRNLLRTLLKAHGLSWKKCQKLLSFAKPEKRQAYRQTFQTHFQQLCQGKIRIIYSCYAASPGNAAIFAERPPEMAAGRPLVPVCNMGE